MTSPNGNTYHLIAQDTTTPSSTGCEERVRSQRQYILRRQRLPRLISHCISLRLRCINLEALPCLLGVQRVLISQRHWKTRALVLNWRRSTLLSLRGMYIAPRMVELPSDERYVFCTSKSSSYLVVQQIAAPTCGTCDVALSRPLACLHCSYVGCWQDGHATRHLKEAGHSFCELNTLLEYCLLNLYLNRHGCQNWIPVLLNM